MTRTHRDESRPDGHVAPRGTARAPRPAEGWRAPRYRHSLARAWGWRPLVAVSVSLGLTLAPWSVGLRAPATAALPRTASGTWTLTAPLPANRGAATATLLPSGQVLIAGGHDFPQGDLASAVLYQPRTGTWSPTGSLTFAAEQGTATLLPSGRVLVVAGSNSQVATNQATLYHPETGTFTLTGVMAIGRVNFTATLLPTGGVLIAGGCNGTSTGCDLTTNSADLYDPASGTFSATGAMSAARQWHTATLLPSGQVLIAGGSPCVACYATASAELYNPATGTFTPTGALRQPRSFASATLLPTGQVLVAGGCPTVAGDCNPAPRTYASAELYNPATGQWHPTGSLVQARSMQTATLLPTGQVLIVGGMNNAGIVGGPLASAELYDPLSGTFTTTASMHDAREFQTATLLPSGQVLVAGGCDNGGGNCVPPMLASAEVYSPLTLTVSAPWGVGGQLLGVAATVFSPGETVRLYWDSPVSAPLGTTTANASGSIATRVRLPLTRRGRHTLIARGQQSGTYAYAYVYVLVGQPLAPASGTASRVHWSRGAAAVPTSR